MSDLISRQEAIEALGEEPEVWTGKDEYAQGLNNQWYYDMIAIKAVPSAQKRGVWIPCSERLPKEDGGLYLVTDYAKSINRKRMHLSRCYMNKEGFWSDVPIGYKVVAWMPLPEPYEEETTK